MNRKLKLCFFLILPISLLATSCDAIRNILSHDLEEEDFTVGELYVDEYVPETPYQPTPSREDKAAGRVNALGIERGPDDKKMRSQQWFAKHRGVWHGSVEDQ